MLEHVASLIDPSTWPEDLSAAFRIWSAGNGTMSRAVDSGEWLAQRDPDGSIRADLNELGELDDGIVSFVDEGLLLAKRLQEAGLDATVEEFPGGHDTLDKHPELVAYLLEIAGE
jgi:enterochelin esterase-like enzyme